MCEGEMNGTGAQPKTSIGWRAGAAALLAAAVLLTTGCGSDDEISSTTTSDSSTSAETTTPTAATTTAATPATEDCGQIEIRFEDGTGEGRLTARQASTARAGRR